MGRDPLPLHVRDGQHFGSVVASGLHTLCVYQRLAVEATYHCWALVAGRALRDVVLPQPVFSEDVVTGSVTVVDVSSPRKGRSRVDVYGELVNQQTQKVLSLHVESYVRCRPGTS